MIIPRVKNLNLQCSIQVSQTSIQMNESMTLSDLTSGKNGVLLYLNKDDRRLRDTGFIDLTNNFQPTACGRLASSMQLHPCHIHHQIRLLRLYLLQRPRLVGAVKRLTVYLFTPERPILPCDFRSFRSEEVRWVLGAASTQHPFIYFNAGKLNF